MKERGGMLAQETNSVATFSEIAPVWVSYPHGLRHAVRNALAEWKQFCQNKLDVKERFLFQEEAGIGDAGYEFRQADPDKLIDGKESFHVVRGELPRLWRYASLSGNFQHGRNFLNAAIELERCAYPFILEFAAGLKRELFLPEDFVHRIENARKHWTFRFLHYLPGGTNPIIAQRHNDKGGFTLHLVEDAPGLEYLPDQDIEQLSEQDLTWLPMNLESGETAIIPGMQMQYFSKGNVKALCHRVVATDHSRLYGRFSIVCFVDMERTAIFDKKRVGRSQILPPGYNYHMPFMGFREFFTDPPAKSVQ